MTACAARASAWFARASARFLAQRRYSASTRSSCTSRRNSIAGLVDGLKRSVTRVALELGLLALVDGDEEGVAGRLVWRVS